MKETGLVVSAKALDASIGKLIGAKGVEGMEMLYLRASVVDELRKALTKEIMEPIMGLQGLRIGFKTDKLYDITVVRECLIEAVSFGVQPTGNQFNIIAGNAYITKEGYGYLLGKITGLDYDIIPELPRISQDKNSAAVKVKIAWNIGNGAKHEKEMEFPIKTNQYMGADGVIGKATRKARKWLYEKITGIETSDGDIEDVSYKIVKDGVADQEVKAEQVKESVKGLFDNK